MTIAPILLSALLAAQAAPPGFSAEALADRAVPAVASRAAGDARARAAATDRLRMAFVLDMASAWRALSPDEYAQFRLAIGRDEAITAPAVDWFMHGAAVRVAGEHWSGLYNPMADVWLLFHWRTSAGAPRIANAFLVPGSALRPADEAEGWARSEGSYVAALATHDARAVARFLDLPALAPTGVLIDWLARARAPLREQALAQIAPWLGGLQAWQGSEAWSQLRTALVAADGFAASLAPVPPAIRRSMIPLGAIRRADGASLLLASPLAPWLFVAVDDPEGAATGRSRVHLVNLAGPPRPAAMTGGAR